VLVIYNKKGTQRLYQSNKMHIESICVFYITYYFLLHVAQLAYIIIREN